MRKILASALILFCAVPLYAQDRPQQKCTAEGMWKVVFFEKDGKQMDLGPNKMVRIHNNTITYVVDGKEKQMKLQFLPNFVVRVYWPEDDREPAVSKEYTHHGVYMLNNEYMGFGLNRGSGAQAQPITPAGGIQPMNAGAQCAEILFLLRRQ